MIFENQEQYYVVEREDKNGFYHAMPSNDFCQRFYSVDDCTLYMDKCKKDYPEYVFRSVLYVSYSMEVARTK